MLCVPTQQNLKIISIETSPGVWGKGNKGEWWRWWIQVRYIWYIVRTFVNATMYPHPTQQLKELIV
jgi:hypothetical protein